MEAREVDVPAIHEVDGPGFDDQVIEERHLRTLRSLQTASTMWRAEMP